MRVFLTGLRWVLNPRADTSWAIRVSPLATPSLFNRGDGSRAAPRERPWTLEDAWFVTASHLPVTRSHDCSGGPTAIGLYRPVYHVRGDNVVTMPRQPLATAPTNRAPTRRE